MEWEEHAEQIAFWRKQLKNAIDCDSWGQVDEAEDIYRSLYTGIKRETSRDATLFNDAEKESLQKLKTLLKNRVKDETISPKTSSAGIKILKELERRAKVMIEREGDSSRTNQDGEDTDDDGTDDADRDTGKKASSKKKKEKEKKKTGASMEEMDAEDVINEPVKLLIKSISIKNAPDFIDPCVRVSVRDNLGNEAMAPSESRIGQNRKGNDIMFDHEFTLIPKASFPDGAAVFLEFLHYKPKSKKNSIKCFAVLEGDELEGGKKMLELYSKPVDFSREKLSLFTTKEFYLKVEVIR